MPADPLHPMDIPALIGAIEGVGLQAVHVRSMAPDPAARLRDPDLAHRLDPESLARLRAQSGVGRDAVLVLADGLAPRAAESHAVPVLRSVVPRLEAAGWRVGPVVVAEQGSVPLGDEIGAAAGAHLAVVLLGEPAGPDAAESLAIHLTWDPAPGRTAAERSCIADVRPGGVSAAAAADRLIRLMTEARARRQSGAGLDNAIGASDA